MKNIIVDAVDFDFPNCGGIIVSKGRKHYTVELVSNYQGNTTGARVRVPITAARTAWGEEDWEEAIEKILYYGTEYNFYYGTEYNYTDCVILSRGHKVE